MQPSVNQNSGSDSVSHRAAGAGAEQQESFTPVVGAWSEAAPWNDMSLRSRRVSIVAGVGLGFLTVLAVGGALLRQMGGSGSSCTDGAECNRLGVLNSRGASSSPATSGSELGSAAVAQDLPQAARLFQRACDLGHAGGCNNLGLAFESGQGVPQDYERAFTLFEHACGGGFAEGCNNQGALYEHGQGVPVNLGDALRLYAQACNHGSALGCSNLGVLYAEGRGVRPDPAEAVQLFTEACSAGSSVGCNNLFEAQHRAPPAN
jgi:TPR repeat protein